MLQIETNKSIIKQTKNGNDIEIVEEFIRVENAEDMKVIKKIQSALEKQLETRLNNYGLTQEQLNEIIGEIYTVLDEEGYGILSPCDDIK